MKISRVKKWYWKDAPRSRENARKQKQKLRVSGLCVRCWKPAEAQRIRCKRCLEKARQEARQLRQQRWREQECYNCGNETSHNYTRCKTCLRKQRRKANERNTRISKDS